MLVCLLDVLEDFSKTMACHGMKQNHQEESSPVAIAISVPWNLKVTMLGGGFVPRISWVEVFQHMVKVQCKTHVTFI